MINTLLFLIYDILRYFMDFLFKLPYNILNRQPLESVLCLLNNAIYNPILVEHIQIVAFILLRDYHFYPPF